MYDRARTAARSLTESKPLVVPLLLNEDRHVFTNSTRDDKGHEVVTRYGFVLHKKPLIYSRMSSINFYQT